MGGKGNVVLLEGPDTIPTAAGRLRGFKDALKEFPDVKVVLSKNAMYARPAAADLLKAMLKLNPPPQIDGILAANDAMAFGAIEAFKEAKKKLPLIVGINASKEAVDLIKAGDMLASGDYNGLIEGCLGAEIAIRTLRKQPVPKEVMAKTSRGRQEQLRRPTKPRPNGGRARPWRAWRPSERTSERAIERLSERARGIRACGRAWNGLNACRRCR